MISPDTPQGTVGAVPRVNVLPLPSSTHPCGVSAAAGNSRRATIVLGNVGVDLSRNYADGGGQSVVFYCFD